MSANTSTESTHQFELCFYPWSNLDGLDSLLTRHLVIEPEESLVRLDALSILVQDLEGHLQHICRPQRERRGGLVSRRYTKQASELETAYMLGGCNLRFRPKLVRVGRGYREARGLQLEDRRLHPSHYQ